MDKTLGEGILLVTNKQSFQIFFHSSERKKKKKSRDNLNSTGTRPIRSKLVLGRAVISIFQYTVSSFPRHAEFLSIPPPRARISVRNGPCIDTTQPTDRKTDPDSLRLAENQREREKGIEAWQRGRRKNARREEKEGREDSRWRETIWNRNGAKRDEKEQGRAVWWWRVELGSVARGQV